MLPQVFAGTDDYQVYTVQPFRLPSWAPGHYLATAMFFEANEVVLDLSNCTTQTDRS